MKRPLIKLSAAISFLLFISCGHNPIDEKPEIELCVIDLTAAPEKQAICGMTNKNRLMALKGSQDAMAAMIPATIERKPISHLDRATAATPTNWEKMENYKDELERFIRNGCKL